MLRSHSTFLTSKSVSRSTQITSCHVGLICTSSRNLTPRFFLPDNVNSKEPHKILLHSLPGLHSLHGLQSAFYHDRCNHSIVQFTQCKFRGTTEIVYIKTVFKSHRICSDSKWQQTTCCHLLLTLMKYIYEYLWDWERSISKSKLWHLNINRFL